MVIIAPLYLPLVDDSIKGGSRNSRDHMGKSISSPFSFISYVGSNIYGQRVIQTHVVCDILVFFMKDWILEFGRGIIPLDQILPIVKIL